MTAALLAGWMVVRPSALAATFLPVAAAGRSLDQSVSLYKSIAFWRVTLRFVSSEMPSNC